MHGNIIPFIALIVKFFHRIFRNNYRYASTYFDIFPNVSRRCFFLPVSVFYVIFSYESVQNLTNKHILDKKNCHTAVKNAKSHGSVGKISFSAKKIVTLYNDKTMTFHIIMK